MNSHYFVAVVDEKPGTSFRINEHNRPRCARSRFRCQCPDHGLRIDMPTTRLSQTIQKVGVDGKTLLTYLKAALREAPEPFHSREALGTSISNWP